MLALLLLSFVCSVSTLPGLAPVTFCKRRIPGKCDSKIDVLSGQMVSPYFVVAYSPKRFDQCTSSNHFKIADNLGQVVFGQQLSLTDFKINFDEPVDCKVLCDKSYDLQNHEEMETYNVLYNAVKSNFRRNWVVDNLPVTICISSLETSSEICDRSIPLGCTKTTAKTEALACQSLFSAELEDATLMLNHFDFKIRYLRVESGAGGNDNNTMGHIISVNVTPRRTELWNFRDTPPKSVSKSTHKYPTQTLSKKGIELVKILIAHSTGKVDCHGMSPLYMKASEGFLVTYTYSVTFEEVTGVSWASRWDYLLSASSHSNIQWLSIINSVIVVVFLTGLVALVLVRTLHRDVLRYNKLESSPNEAHEEFGWKLVHADVFRAPKHAMLLSVCVGSGTQLALMMVITLFFACFGILTPAHRGAFATCALAVFVCLGASAGYVSARLYKFFGGLRWKTNVLATALFCPGAVVSVFLLLNCVLAVLHSSSAISFTPILALLAMWLLVSLPLCFIGAFFGFRRSPISVPTRTNQIPRQIPKQTIYSRTIPTVLMAGLLPFGCIFIQLFFIFSSIWGQQLFFMFGFLFIIFVILIVSTSETTILLCYFQLCSENYMWCWRAFFSGGSAAIYVVLYSVRYYLTTTAYKGFLSAFLYFTYTIVVAWLLFIMLGSVGFLASFLFVRNIYAAVKVD